jgi:hypothetical protein
MARTVRKENYSELSLLSNFYRIHDDLLGRKARAAWLRPILPPIDAALASRHSAVNAAGGTGDTDQVVSQIEIAPTTARGCQLRIGET